MYVESALQQLTCNILLLKQPTIGMVPIDEERKQYNQSVTVAFWGLYGHLEDCKEGQEDADSQARVSAKLPPVQWEARGLASETKGSLDTICNFSFDGGDDIINMFNIHF